MLKRLQQLAEAQDKKREAASKLRNRASTPKPPPRLPVGNPHKAVKRAEVLPVERPPVLRLAGRAKVPVFKDEDDEPSVPSTGLQQLVDLYLHAARHRTRHIVLSWPNSPTTLSLVHGLATLERWVDGDKQGVRGLLYPTKSNAFHPLNHIHLGRAAVVERARALLEVQTNPEVTRSLPEKDAFLFSLNSLKPEAQEQFNPSVNELLPSFLAGPGYRGWEDCSDKLLAHLSAKLTRRAQAKALKRTSGFVGQPATAPDALFALDGRMTEVEQDAALKALSSMPNLPEVVLIRATKDVRGPSTGWRGRIAKFILKLERFFGNKSPGILVVVDEPYAIRALQDELVEQCRKRERHGERGAKVPDFQVLGVPFLAKSEGLLSPGETEQTNPEPRNFDVHVVDSDSAKTARRFSRLASSAQGGREVAQPIVEAISYVTRVGALPCGISDLTDYLSGSDISSATRAAFDWLGHVAAIRDFERSGGVQGQRGELEGCITDGSNLFAKYQAATPFAMRLAKLVEASVCGGLPIGLVFASSLNRLLAERFLRRYTGYEQVGAFADLEAHVHFLTARQLEEQRDVLAQGTVAFVGLSQEALRFLMTDNGVPDGASVLITQRNGQVLRAGLGPISTRFPEFAAFKPRIDALLSKLGDLPEDASVFSSGDYTLPTFRVELAADVSNGPGEMDPEAWKICLEGGSALYRRPTHRVYVYDPSSHLATDRGFRPAEVSSLEVGDKVFVMSGELREMVEQSLRDAGVQIQSDKTFEGALRTYHQQVGEKLAGRFKEKTRSDQVRSLRKAMVAINPALETELPTEQAMRHWVDLGASANTAFDQLKPQAPLKEANFRAFAGALGFSPLEAAYLWQRVILAIRNSRRIDGRHVSDIYAYMLLQPESAMVHSGITRQTLQQLFERARANVWTVEAVGPLKEASN
jgi:hypothetical protein